MPTRRRPPRERLAAPARRTSIEDAALRVFGERGYHDATLDEVAAMAGITKPIIYQHFGSKRDLFIHLLARQTAALLTAVTAASTLPDATPEARLRAGVDGFFAWVNDAPFARQILFRDAAADPEVASAHEEAQRSATTAIAAALAADADLLPHDANRELALEVTAQMLKTGLNGVAAWWLRHPSVERGWLVDRVMALCWVGLAPGLRPPGS